MELFFGFGNWMNYWFNFWDLNKTPKVDHRNAKFKVVKTTTKEDVYYTNNPCPEKAKEEAWTAIGINKEGVKTAITKVDMSVIENPHRMIDDDGYDTVTGLKYK